MSAAAVFYIVLSAIITNNYVLSKFLGICPFLGVSKKLNSAMGMSIAVIFVMVIATAVTWPIQTYLLDPHGIGFMQTIIFILVIAALVQMIEIFLKKYIPALHKSLGIYLPLITTNCAILGVCVLNIDNGYGFLQSMLNSFGSGVGFLLAMFLFAGVRSKIETNDYPEAFKGVASTLIAASITSLCFLGFSGMLENIFGM
ncbi:MAG: RnfABCDGE type electron transport complex subunit A [Firmicutes bacterium]|nr:RnfABCDGE type electron transport complex subunit A [Bacillota bacterium]MBQ2042452.1 RnfABCDGE type electron transport complex subunit A [Bacillota bacterium]MBQ2310956.1 RnfABCDGE type electron transport complex subunit A [Bacillota bacterium]MBQ3931660.1 RnfABCDGE type electron transport complex subunit A [Bacillota bacterium]